MSPPNNFEELDRLWELPTPKKRIFFEAELGMEVIGRAIRDIRRSKKLTQEQLGVMVGVQRSQIAKIENVKKDARISTVVKVFKALGIKVHFSLLD
ncbi:MAG: helix-turn-helix transcriptional regulator [Saprospiraceae bacterium]